MKPLHLLAILAFLPAGTSAASRPIRDGVGLNIGISCQWQVRCMVQQRGAMRQALDFVARTRPPQWRIQLCNRNAGKGAGRVDWVGYNNCIRNARLNPPARNKRRSP
jgi:hypothetical protein